MKNDPSKQLIVDGIYLGRVPVKNLDRFLNSLRLNENCTITYDSEFYIVVTVDGKVKSTIEEAIKKGIILK